VEAGNEEVSWPVLLAKGALSHWVPVVDGERVTAECCGVRTKATHTEALAQELCAVGTAAEDPVG